MKGYPRITIVLQCFNRKDYIEKTILSVTSQNYPNLECIVIDGGSTDGSWEIIQKHKDKLAIAEQYKSSAKTAVPGLNYGFSKSTGEIMTSLNDKNLLMPGSLFTMAKVFSTFSHVDWVTGIGLVAQEDDIIAHVVPIRKDLYEHLMWTPWNIQHESTFWRRSLWEKTGGKFSEEFPWGFDADLWSRFFATGAQLYFLNTIVGAYRKLPTAHGVKNRAEYQIYSRKAWTYLRSKVAKKELYYAKIYRFLRYLKPLLRNIPDSIFQHIPLLNHFAQDSIGFRPDLVIYKRNPFRTIYPW